MFLTKTIFRIKIDYTLLLFFNIFILSTALSPFIDDLGLNMLLVAVMVVFISSNIFNLLKIKLKDMAIYLLPITMLASGLLYYNQFRISSYLYGLLFVGFYLVNLNYLRKGDFTIFKYQKLLKLIIYAFFVVLLLQQIMFFLGVENFINKIFTSDYKFNSLATEPSHCAIIIVFIFYSYIRSVEVDKNERYNMVLFKADKLIWFVFIYEMLTFGSSYGILLLLLFLVSFVKNYKYFIYIGLLGLAFVFIAVSYNFTPIMRLCAVFSAVGEGHFDIRALVLADHSASVRLIPMFYFFTTFNFVALFGMGMDFSSNFFPTIIPGVKEGMGGGIFPSYIIDYGLVNASLLIYIIRSNAIKSIFNFGFFAFLFTLLNTSFNSQLFWFTISILTINTFMYKQYEIKY